MIAHPIQAFRQGRDERDRSIVTRTPSGAFRMQSQSGDVAFLPTAAIGAKAPSDVQRAALRAFTTLTNTEIASVGVGFEGLRAVVERICRSEAVEPERIGFWLRSRNRGLVGFRRPLEALRDGRTAEVMVLAECFVALTPPPAPSSLLRRRADIPQTKMEDRSP